MKIYIAGPEVFESNPLPKGAELKRLCLKHGAEGLYPMDNELLDTERGSIDEASYIREANLALIRSCDAIIANMTPFRSPSMDVGTAYEMGVGAALDKIVVGYTSNTTSYVDKVKELFKIERGHDQRLRDEQDMAVEEFRDGRTGLIDNLMVACGIGRVCSTAEEAIIVATERHKRKQAQIRS